MVSSCSTDVQYSCQTLHGFFTETVLLTVCNTGPSSELYERGNLLFPAVSCPLVSVEDEIIRKIQSFQSTKDNKWQVFF